MKRPNFLPRDKVTLQVGHHCNGLRPGPIADANYEGANFTGRQFSELKVQVESFPVV